MLMQYSSFMSNEVAAKADIAYFQNSTYLSFDVCRQVHCKIFQVICFVFISFIFYSFHIVSFAFCLCNSF